MPEGEKGLRPSPQGLLAQKAALGKTSGNIRVQLARKVMMRNKTEHTAAAAAAAANFGIIPSNASSIYRHLPPPPSDKTDTEQHNRPSSTTAKIESKKNKRARARKHRENCQCVNCCRLITLPPARVASALLMVAVFGQSNYY